MDFKNSLYEYLPVWLGVATGIAIAALRIYVTLHFIVKYW